MLENYKEILNNYKIKIYGTNPEYLPSLDHKLFVLYAKYFSDFLVELWSLYRELSDAERAYYEAYKLSYDAYIASWEKTTPASDKAKSDNMSLYLAWKEAENREREYDKIRRWFQFDLKRLEDRIKTEWMAYWTQIAVEKKYDELSMQDDPLCPF